MRGSVGGSSPTSESTMVRGGSLGRDMSGIAGDTVGAMVGAAIAQRNAEVAKERTERAIGNVEVDRVANASTSTLYGPGSNVDDVVGQAAQAYRGDAGTQFAQQTNWNLSLQAGLREQAFVGGLQDEFGQRANDALAASRAQDQALKQQLGGEVASSANGALAGQRAEHAAAAARSDEFARKWRR
jgi:hypothetical protein